MAWLPMNTTEPPCSFIDGITACVICIVPKRLISRACRQLSQSASSSPPNTASSAAQFTSASIVPKRSMAVAASRAHCSGSVMSVTSHATFAPDGSISAAAFSRFAWVRAPIATLAPSRSAAAAISRPRPGPTPDTTTVLPSRIIGRSFLSFGRTVPRRSGVNGAMFRTRVRDRRESR